MQDFTIWLKILLTLIEFFFKSKLSYSYERLMLRYNILPVKWNTLKTLVYYLIMHMCLKRMKKCYMCTSYYQAQCRLCPLNCNEMPCCSSCFRSSLRQPKVPVTLEILQSITLSSAHLHAHRKWKSQYKYLLAYVIKCIST